MKGMYVNIKFDKDCFDDESLETGLNERAIQLGEHSILVRYHDEFSIFEDGNSTAIMYGWAFAQGQVLQVEDLIALYAKQTLDTVEAGNFVVLVVSDSSESPLIITDPFGLSSHYVRLLDNLQIAPTVSAFEDKKYEVQWQSFQKEQGHLVGNKTIYQGITRLSPGSITIGNVSKPYIDVAESDKVPLDDVFYSMRNLVLAWDKKRRVCPVSSGFDSRFISSLTNYSYGYTYGREDSTERRIARKVSVNCEQYFELEFTHDTKEAFRDAETYMFEGTVVSGLLETYQRAKQKIAEVGGTDKYVLFDGYLGDGLQRATYLKLGGLVGSLFLLFPQLYRLNLSTTYLLKRRYRNLSEDNFKLLLEEFARVTDDKPLTSYQKVTYFESLYGRGGRYIINGGNIACSQFFIVCSPFTHKSVFATLLHQDLRRTVEYKNLRLLWKSTAEVFRSEPTESGIAPDSPAILAPYKRVIHALLERLRKRGRTGY